MLRYGWVFLLLTVPSWAQSNLATLSGRIEDATQAPISNAQVSVTAKATGATRKTTSDSSGLFEVPNLMPGEYSVTVSAQGLNTLNREVVLEVGQHMALSLTMQIGEHHEAVAVYGEADLLKTQDVSLGEVVEPKSIDDLPLNGRMLIDLVLTVPGAHLGHGAQTGDMNPLYWRPGQRSAVTIGGNRPNANYFLLDGVTNTEPTFNTQNLSPSPDAVREFQVQTGSYSAEMGGAGGGQINIVTRQGTSQFHGTAYEYLRNNVLDARTWNEMPGTDHLVQNNFGGALGGPVFGKKTFFFANYEGLRETQAQTMIDTVPTEAESSGDFSDAGATIYNPYTTHSNPNYDPSKPAGPTNPKTLRDPFPGNIIPPNLINSASSKMLKNYVPMPNQMDMGMSGMTMMGTPTVFGTNMDSNNYLDVRNMQHANNQGTIRVDRLWNAADTMSVRYSASSEIGFMPQNLPGFGFNHDNMAQNGSVIWTHVISPTLVNTASAGVSRLAMSHWQQNSSVNDIVSQLGITGVGYGGPVGWGAPYFNVQGYSPMGDSYQATPMSSWSTLLEGKDVLSWMKGRHSLKFGGSYRWLIWPMKALVQSRGYYSFTSGFTTETSSNDGTGSALASMLLGMPVTRQLQAGTPTMDLRQWSTDAFVQDTWRATASTTIDVGLRYEYSSALTDTQRTWSNLYQDSGSLTAFIGGQLGYPRGLMYPSKLRFAPRVGFAQQFQHVGIVFRAAYGIFYTPVDLNTWCNQLHNVPLVFPITQQSDNFIPQFTNFNMPTPVFGKTVTSFTAFDPYAASQYVQQWSASIQKSLGASTTLEVGYQGARGIHLQQAVLINNALPGPGAIQPRRPYQFGKFLPGTEFPDGITDTTNGAFPVSTVNNLENRAHSWYDAGYVNVRRRFSHGLSLLANYTYAKNLSNAPDFRSPMFESAIPQNNNDLDAEKGPACDIRHRFALSAVADIPSVKQSNWLGAVTRNWRISTVYQAQSGFPFTISVFGDTANSGTVLGENPIRANYTGQPVFGPGTQTTSAWFNPAAFSTPAAYTFGNLGRNTVYGPGLQTLDLALMRVFPVNERLSMEFRAEAFNSLNHSNYGTPNRFVNTAQFGTITEASTPGRVFQLSARLSF
jgi:hypothetical protein